MRKANSNKNNAVDKVWARLSAGDIRVLDERILSQDEAKGLAESIGDSSSFGDVFHIIEALPIFSKTYDWNVGTLLLHLDGELTVSAMQHAGDRRKLYESVGLAWALGQFRSRNAFVVDYLRSVVREAENSDAWWQAAFSLERLGVDDAVNLLKRSLRREKLGALSSYLRCLDNKRSLIAILLLCDAGTQRIAYPALKKAVMSRDYPVVANACWLLGRLHIADDEISKRLSSLVSIGDYDCRHNAFYALMNNPNSASQELFVRSLQEGDELARRMGARGLRAVTDERTVSILESALDEESSAAVSYEITKTLSRIRNIAQRNATALKRKGSRFENGMISSPNIDPAKFNLFAEARDPDGVCFGLIRRRLAKKVVKNPIDVATGSGRIFRQLFENVPYQGTLYGLDTNKAMCAFADTSLRRERNFMSDAKIVVGSPSTFSQASKVKSNCVVSAFGFSRISKDRKLLARELQAIHDMLTDDGEFYTVGWDELYNDAFGTIWYKFVPDAVQSRRNFDEWREEKMRVHETRSSAGLSWLHRGVYAPLQFRSMEESARVMGYLFGRDAAQYVIRNERKEWGMSLGITCDTKKSLRKIIEGLSRERE